MRLSKIYTRQGDGGKTRLAEGTEVRKDTLLVETYGEVDELNSVIGLVISQGPDPKLKDYLEQVQHILFDVGGELASAGSIEPLVHETSVKLLETQIDELNGQLKPLEEFILPGGAETAATIHLARTVCRRCERRVVTLLMEHRINPHILEYLNRLSDLLFVMARYENLKKEHPEIFWKNPRRQ